MGYIKEPTGVDFFVDPKPLTAAERKRISEIIAYYKATGRKMPIKKTIAKERTSGKRNRKVLV
ncbi:MAG: hypothetical protein HYR66_10580 [Sphingobacteriales bacterium]|nr:hypothetical protein [Sphingobacteriales bacterium]MBI3718740.1 hypothetical protein [Sphingobacteriales bacterium]